MEPKSATWTFPSKLHDILDLWDLGLQHMLEMREVNLGVGRWTGSVELLPKLISCSVPFSDHKVFKWQCRPFRDWNGTTIRTGVVDCHAVRRTNQTGTCLRLQLDGWRKIQRNKGSAKLLGNISGQLLSAKTAWQYFRTTTASATVNAYPLKNLKISG